MSRLHWLILSMAVTFPSEAAIKFDLNTDFSTVNNPNGPWSYRQGSSLMAASVIGGELGAPTPVWSGMPPAFIAKAVVTASFDWLAGDMIGHTIPAVDLLNVLWTAPEAGLVSVSGATWMVRDIDRSNLWSILVNNAPVTSGLIFSGDPYDRNTPFLFADGAGGAAALSDIPIAAGDTIELRYSPTSAAGDYVGMDFTISYIPEPSTLWLGIPAVILPLLRKRRRGALTTSAGNSPSPTPPICRSPS